MAKPYLEITYRSGKPFAAYLYLDRRAEDTVARTVPVGALLVDYAPDGRVIGVEIPNPGRTTTESILKELEALQVSVAPAELRPLAAA